MIAMLRSRDDAWESLDLHSQYKNTIDLFEMKTL